MTECNLCGISINSKYKICYNCISKQRNMLSIVSVVVLFAILNLPHVSIALN